MAQKLIKTAGSNSFMYTQVVNLGVTKEDQLLIAIRNLWYGSKTTKIVGSLMGVEATGIYVNKPIVVVKSKLSEERRQINVASAVVISPSYWATVFAAASPSVQKQSTIYDLTAEFLRTGDRFSRILPRLSPVQTRVDKTYEVLNVGGIGKVDLGFPFISSSLQVTGPAPVATFPSLGYLQYDLPSVGSIIDVSFVSDAVYNVIKVLRTHTQPVGSSTGAVHSEFAYVMHPALADLLGIPLPVI